MQEPGSLARCGTYYQIVPVTNEFGHLPLVQVACRVVVSNIIPVETKFTIDLMHELASKDEIILDVQDLPGPDPTPGANQPIFFSSRPVRIVMSGGCAIRLQPNMLTVEWESDSMGPGTYPRFEALKGKIEQCFGAIEELLGRKPGALVVNMQYVNSLGSGRLHEDPWKYIAEPYRPKPIGDNPKLLNSRTIWRIQDIYDFRYEIERLETIEQENGQNAYTLICVAGSKLEPENDPIGRLVEVHDLLNEEFKSIISKEAKAEWHWKQ